MYRSLSDQGSFTEYVYVLPAPLVTADPVVVLNPTPFLFLSGHRILCPNSRLGHRPSLLTMEGPTSAAPCTLHLSPSQRGLRRRMRPRRSFQMTKCMWGSLLADQSPPLRIRTRKATSPDVTVWPHLDEISHLFRFHLLAFIDPKIYSGQPDVLDLLCFILLFILICLVLFTSCGVTYFGSAANYQCIT